MKTGSEDFYFRYSFKKKKNQGSNLKNLKLFYKIFINKHYKKLYINEKLKG